MNTKYKFRFFAHSWVSDWNHGNAHFLRGLARELTRMGHEVRCYEELGAWSLTNLVTHEGTAAISAIVDLKRYLASTPQLDEWLRALKESAPGAVNLPAGPH